MVVMESTCRVKSPEWIYFAAKSEGITWNKGCQCQREAEEQRKAAEERQRRMERIKRRKAQDVYKRQVGAWPNSEGRS